MDIINEEKTSNGIEFSLGNTVFEVIINYERGVTRKVNKLHDHFAYENFFVKSGKVTVSHGGEEYTASENEIVCLPKLVQHISLYDDATFFGVVFSFRKNDASNKKTENTYPIFKKVFDGGITMITCTDEMRKVFDEFIEGESEYNALGYYLVESRLKQFFILLTQAILERKRFSVQEVRPLGMVDYIIKKRLCFATFDDIKLSDLAKELYISERQLSRKIKQIYGVSFSERKLQLRVETAKVYLEKTDFSIEQISSKLNFYDTSAFNKTFKRETGLSPTQYRKRKNGECKKEGRV